METLNWDPNNIYPEVCLRNVGEDGSMHFFCTCRTLYIKVAHWNCPLEKGYGCHPLVPGSMEYQIRVVQCYKIVFSNVSGNINHVVFYYIAY